MSHLVVLVVHIIAASRALFLGYTHVAQLRVCAAWLPRYTAKLIKLAVCSLAFCSRHSLRQAYRAGTAAFVFCVYDVCTDWHWGSATDLTRLMQAVEGVAGASFVNVTQCLVDAEAAERVPCDGLDRGRIAALSAMTLIGSIEHYRRTASVMRIGRCLQLIDDIRDYEADLQNGHVNCLRTANWSEYLPLLGELDTRGFQRGLFLMSPMLRFVCLRAVSKLRRLQRSGALLPSGPLTSVWSRRPLQPPRSAVTTV